MKALLIFRGLHGVSGSPAQPAPGAGWQRCVLVLALSWQREGRRGVRFSELPAPPRTWTLLGGMAWDSPQILTSPHSSILRR